MGRGRPKQKSEATKRVRKPAPERKRVPLSERRAVETALASLAHDIRTPLTGIIALADLLIASDLPDQERGWARSIRGTADHLAQLTSVVLDGVKAERAGLSIRSDAFSPRKLAEAVAASLSARAGASGLAAEVSIGGDLPAQVAGDPVRLRAALENLIDNAVKFTARGCVRFVVTAERAPRRRMRLHFAVSDSGTGLTKAELAKLFRPFVQASKQVSLRYGGSGLGLVLVKRLAKAMGGDLAVVSRKGEGSTFTLTVTVKEAPERTGPKQKEGGIAADAVPEASLRILCVEDNPFGRMVLNAILTELGHRVDFAGSGEAAVNAMHQGYDVVFMDVMLPDMDGLEATRRIRALPGEVARTPIIGISGRSSKDDARKARDAGMTDYLTKPVSPAALVEALRRLR